MLNRMSSLIAVILLLFITCWLQPIICAAEEIVELLNSENGPIQLGDNRGDRDDIKEFLKAANVEPKGGLKYRPWWEATFNFTGQVKSVSVDLEIFSLNVDDPKWDCPTYLLVNGHRVSDLRLLPGGGYNRTAKGTIALPRERLQNGSNRLRIEEELCTNTQTGKKTDALNDSLLLKVLLKE